MPSKILIPENQKVYRIEPGNLGIYNPGRRLEWMSCRDTLYKPHGWRLKYRGFFYCLTKAEVPQLQTFLDQIETHLKINGHSVVHPTNYPNIVWIMPAKFWAKQQMRAAMLTILLRAFLGYNPNSDWLDQVMKFHYIKDTRNAALRFFDGYTWYTGKERGWCVQFDPAYTRAKVEDLLVKPKSHSFWKRLFGRKNVSVKIS